MSLYTFNERNEHFKIKYIFYKDKEILISILFSETCTELECIWPLMIVLLAIISLLKSDQSLKFSIVEAGEFVGGVETVNEK